MEHERNIPQKAMKKHRYVEYKISKGRSEMSRNNSQVNHGWINLLAVFFILIQLFSLIIHPPTEVSSEISGQVRSMDELNAPLASTRYGNKIVEDFKNLNNIDISNTTCTINTKAKRITFESSKSYSPTYVSSVNMNTRSHGGGYSPMVDEYWYPQWSGNTVYRYNSGYSGLGQFNLGTPHIMQIWSDIDGTFYGAHWGYNTINKWSVDPNNWQVKQVWSFNIGSTAGSVTCDAEFVYAMRWSDRQVRVLRKSDGQNVRNFNLPSYCYNYGTMAYANGILYVGGYNRDHRRVGMFNPQNGAYLGDFRTNRNIYNMAYNGEEYCVSDNGNSVSKYRISEGNSYFGDRVDPNSKTRYVQSKVLYQGKYTLGAVRLDVVDSKPQGTTIEYKATADGVNWEKITPGENHVFEHIGSKLMWNATLTTDDVDDGPMIEEITIEFDLFSEPEPYAPSSLKWQGTTTPKLEWNFTDPDKNDIQSDYLVEIYDDEDMKNIRYNSSWVNSSEWEHTVNEALEDGVYYWRVRTKDGFHATSNFSVSKKLMIDVTKPIGNITIEEGVLSVNDKLVDLLINASDYGSGVADMQLIGDRGNAGPWEEFKSEKRVVLSPTDGLKMIRVRFRDNAGIVSEDFNDTVYFDLKGPFDVMISSPTHPDPQVFYNSTLPVFSWDPPYEVTGIKGYSYTVDSTPLTEPTKVLYSQNDYLTGTYPGEFAGLSEGTWYFHITPCDVYEQWGNTTHFKFNIDSVPPVASELVPSSNVWFGETGVTTEITFYDRDGYGLDTDSIAYSYRKSGESSFSGWTDDGMKFEILEEGEEGYPAKVRAWTELVFSEGDRNGVMWRVSDMSGNGPVYSEKRAVKVDLSPVTFSEAIPLEDEISTENTVSVGITIDDTGGSGVDGKTVEYSISKYGGDDDKYFTNWTLINNNMVKESLIILLDIEFEPGRDNYIKWRAKDAVGNGYSVSEASQVWVNSPPEPVIDAPFDDEKFEEGSSVRLSAEGTSDNEDDELGYYWVIKAKTSKKIVFRGYKLETQAVMDQQGKFLVYLYVDDGYGFNESVKLDIEVLPKPTGKEAEAKWEDTTDSDEDTLPDWWEKMNGLDPNNPDDATQEMKDTYKRELAEHKGVKTTEEGLLSKYWWIFIIIGALSLILIIGIVVVTRRKRKKKEETENVVPKRIAQERPYPVGSRDFYHPQYSQMANTYQGQTAYGTQFPAGGSQQSIGTQYERRPPVSEYLSPAGAVGPGQSEPIALPMASQVPAVQQSSYPVNQPSSTISPTGPAILPAQQVQQYEQGAISSVLPQYTLPSFASDQGTINLNLLALPPAAEDTDMGLSVEELLGITGTADTMSMPQQSFVEPITIENIASVATPLEPTYSQESVGSPIPITPVAESPVISPITSSPITTEPLPVAESPVIAPITSSPITAEPLPVAETPVISPITSSPIATGPLPVSEPTIISPPTPSPIAPESLPVSESTTISPPTPSPIAPEPSPAPEASQISPPAPSEPPSAAPASTADNILDDIFGSRPAKSPSQPPPEPPSP